ncbi:hypothetical protein BDA96_03G238500 [Sorghum bicolor]|uniref:Uncharacterized protein n=2 Tax=Sorghum bicolor TaxID=4558 RepID=A0A921UNM4_SORBI|nr:hypothetical protein BDA96_03G238500 [Sorghum bicolor]OQU87169.1 hypothetical protein SORBI_3003G220266 [Sorghum bicolor]
MHFWLDGACIAGIFAVDERQEISGSGKIEWRPGLHSPEYVYDVSSDEVRSVQAFAGRQVDVGLCMMWPSIDWERNTVGAYTQRLPVGSGSGTQGYKCDGGMDEWGAM